MDWRQRTIEVAQEWGLDPSLAVAQIQAESNFNPLASSGVAYGLAQFTLSTWALYGNGGDIWNGEDSLQAWARYMTHLLDYFQGDYRLALAGYHSGESAARAALNNPTGNPKTNAYVNKILSAGGQPLPQDVQQASSGIDFAGNESNALFFIAAGVLLYYLVN